jgi:hypothetical protein
MATLEKSFCNDEAVFMLRQFLAYAEQGQVGFVALTVVEPPNGYNDDHIKAGMTGATVHHKDVLKGLNAMQKQLRKSILNRTLPTRRVKSTADFVCYNAADGPYNFDFTTWLIDQEMIRRREGASTPLKVGFWFGRDEGAQTLKNPLHRKFLDGVMRPSLALVGAIEHQGACDGRAKEMYLPRDIITSAKAGESVPRFKAPVHAQEAVADYLRGRPTPVTITLRESDEWPHRNSNLEAWLKFAEDYLSPEEVVIVRDTSKAFARSVSRYREFPAASIDLHYRAALYEAARVNLFVSNGPSNLAVFGDRPYLIFIDVQPDGFKYYADTPSFWTQKMGLTPGEQYPWASPQQRIIWGKDTYENIEKAWASVVLSDHPQPKLVANA